MNIKQLETFVRIVELGSFNAAAGSLHASPSTVSGRIKELERTLGVELFDRSFHRAQLTSEGHALHAHARELVAFTEALAQQMRAPAGTSGLLRLGVVGLVANTWLPAFVAALRERYPLLALRIETGLTRPLLERLADGKLDLAIVAGHVDDPELHAERLGHDRFVWTRGGVDAGFTGSADESDAGTPQALTPQSLARHPVLALTEDSHHHPIVRDWFDAGGVTLRPAVSCNNMNVLAALTMRGLGVSLLPRRGYRAELASGALVELPTTPALPQVAFAMVHRKARVPPLADALAGIARTLCDLPETSDTPAASDAG